MVFFLARKLLKDRAQGLAFQWRGIDSASAFSYFIAFILTAVVIGGVLFGINVEVPSEETREKVKASEVSYISRDHPHLRSLSQFASPLPPVWEPSMDSSVNYRHFKKLNNALLETEALKVELIRPEPLEPDVSLPLVATRTEHLPALSPPSTSKKPVSGTCEMSLRIEDDTLAKRLLSSNLTFDGEIMWHDRGIQSSYTILVNRNGEVELCSPIVPSSFDGLEPWIRNLKFKPVEVGDTIAKIILTVKPVEK